MNQFSKSEANLVSRLVTIAIVHDGENHKYIEMLLKTTADREVKKYAQPCDQNAAAQAVIELVKERLNVNP